MSNQVELIKRFPWLSQFTAATVNFPRENRYLVGVSGGLDSRVLLHLLLQFGFDRLVVCHLNHNLRGKESLEDRLFVQRLCRRLRLPFYSEELDRLPAGSLENTARQARLQFFARAAGKFSTWSVFLAHHADDQVETFLFNLFRGSGPLENAAIKWISTIAVGDQKLTLLRPLLKIWKNQLRDFATMQRLGFREDSSNRSRSITRNRIRNDLIPTIEKKLNRSIKGAIQRTIELVIEEGNFVRSQVPPFSTKRELAVREIRDLPVAIQRRVIHRWLRQHQIPDCGFAEVEAIRVLIARKDIAKINLPGGTFCRRRSGVLFLQFP